MTDIARLTAALADRYRIERELGAGGMATVYLARDLKHDREVAIKVLREDLAASMGPARFLREIQIAAQLQHPNILPLLDSGEAEGFLYYVMPFVKGQSLRERLSREGELPIHEAVRLLTEVVDALAHAHEHGVVHRDIKPDNVMLSGRHALVADFGVAKAISEATGRNTVTTLGVAVGTPAYMSPEQAAADPHIDHRSDIYAVGVVAYELLTGRPPFTGTTPQQVLAAHVTEAPDPLSKRRPGVPPGLEMIVMRCLAKRPADRWQTATELHAQFEPLATPSIGITPTSTRPLDSAMMRPVPGATKWLPWAIAGAVIVVAAAFVMSRGKTGRGAIPSPIRAQVTTSGEARTPSISPDGKVIAYSTTSCDASGRCLYNMIVQDIGGAGALTVASGASAIYTESWSPDGRFLVLSAVFGPQYGQFLVPATVQGQPQYLGCCDADFVGTSDTLLLAQQPLPGDTVAYLRLLTVSDRRVRDSIRIERPGNQINVAVSHDGQRIAVVISGKVVRIMRRDGHVVDTLLKAAGTVQWAPDGRGLIFSSFVPGATDVYDLLYQALDGNGRRAGSMDTLISRMTMQGGFFSVTHDGSAMAYAQGTRVNSLVSLKRTDLATTKFTQRILATSTAALNGGIAPDGRLVHLVRARPGSGDQPRWQLSYMSSDSGAETNVTPLLDTLIDHAWTSGTSARLAFSFPSGKGVDRVDEFDVATGRTRTLFSLPDTTASLLLNSLHNGKYLAFRLVDRDLALLSSTGAEEKRFKLPAGLARLGAFASAPSGDEIALMQYNTGDEDSVVVYRMKLADGTAREVAAIVAEGHGGLQWLDNGDLLVIISETRQTHALYRVAPTGEIKRIGVVPFGEQVGYTITRDGKHFVASVSDPHGDVWVIKNFAKILHHQ